LTEKHDAETRDSKIFQAVNPKSITLMSSSFGRGTDFAILNDKIKENGGLHVIHAFLSLDESEEVQIKGRTARQNCKGSYDCIISEDWLEELDLTSADFPASATSNDIHNILLRAREKRIEKLSQTTINLLF
jgi:preprotein translocase subunit SecA